MTTFFCETEMGPYFSLDSQEIEAAYASIAAEIYAARIFDEEEFDSRPINVYVAESRTSPTAVRFEVKRSVVITDDARELGEVDVPPLEEE